MSRDNQKNDGEISPKFFDLASAIKGRKGKNREKGMDVGGGC